MLSFQLLHNSDQEHLLSLNSVGFAGKADLFEVHAFSLRDVDISLAVPSPSVLPEYCWSSGHLSKSEPLNSGNSKVLPGLNFSHKLEVPSKSNSVIYHLSSSIFILKEDVPILFYLRSGVGRF